MRPTPATTGHGSWTRRGGWEWTQKALVLPVSACHWTAPPCLWHWAARMSSIWLWPIEHRPDGWPFRCGACRLFLATSRRANGLPLLPRRRTDLKDETSLMSDSNDTPRERKPLGIKRSLDAGEVKQTFSHGRTNKVVVEVKRRRVIGRPGDTPAPAPAPEPVAAPPPPPPPPPQPKKKAAPAGETPQERVARLQREAEEERLRLTEEATRREAEERARAAEEERRRAEENRRAGQEAEARAAAEAEAAAAAPIEEAQPSEEVESGSASPTPAPRKV